jgi:hypothetical protein
MLRRGWAPTTVTRVSNPDSGIAAAAGGAAADALEVVFALEVVALRGAWAAGRGGAWGGA